MQIELSLGQLTWTILGSASVGGVIGALVVGIFSGAQVTSLQTQLESKKEFICPQCPYFERNRELHEKLDRREAYVRTLEDRCKTLTRSKASLGNRLQRRVA